MLRAVLFDLDDTLYPEWDFVRGGFAIVAQTLATLGVGTPADVMELLERLHFDGGREGVFDRAAQQLGFTADLVPKLVELFREHAPSLKLEDESRRTLESLRDTYRLGCVTDGFAHVQRRKIDSLGIEVLFDAIVVADELGGRALWKPDPRPFHHCCELLAVEPGRAAFVGDNPERDLWGAHRAGLLAIRIRRPDGYFRDSASGAGFRHEVASLPEVPGLLARLSNGP